MLKKKYVYFFGKDIKHVNVHYYYIYKVIFTYFLYLCMQELRDQIRKLQEDKRQGIKHLEKQRLELLQAFKKQLLLIDNLKKQNVCNSQRLF